MFKLLKKIRLSRKYKSKKLTDNNSDSAQTPLRKKLPDNLQSITGILGSSSDIIVRQIKIGTDKKTDAAIIYIDGLVDKDLVNQNILRPLMFDFQLLEADQNIKNSSIFDYILTTLLTVGDICKINDLNMMINEILSGNTVLLIDGFKQGLTISVRGWKSRNIEESTNEATIKGPKQSFNESLRTNTALLRRIIKDPALTFDSFKIGQRSQTDVNIVYVKGIAKDSLIEEIKRRMQKIDTDLILDVGYIEQFIEDNPLSLFPSAGFTERPDVAAAQIIEGRAAILVDGTPFALTIPRLFIEGFQNPDDYYTRPGFASFISALRYFSFAVSIYLPAIYVALVSFHQEMIPSPLLITIAAAKEGLPFPTVVEALLMVILFEILREAGLRMPRTFGQAVSIVGALVIGQAAVSAGIVGAPMVIVLATAAITSFVAPDHANAGAILRIIMILMAGFLGIFGIIIISLECLSQLAAQRSFGVPFLAPITPTNFLGFKDMLIRAPLWMIDYRPAPLEPDNIIRQGAHQKPSRLRRRNS